MDFFCIDGKQVVTAPIISGTSEEIQAANICDHPEWLDSGIGIPSDGEMQKCIKCSAIRFSINELKKLGVKFHYITLEEYNDMVSRSQKKYLKERV